MSDPLNEIRRAIVLSLVRSSGDELQDIIGDLEHLQGRGYDTIPINVDGDAYGLSVVETIRACKMLLERQQAVSVRVTVE